MESGTYDLERGKEDFVYWFYSEGPRGRIRKMVRFQPTPELGRNAFNLAFGDFDESTGKINDLAISNNSDHLRVLHTVAEVILDFICFWPKAIIKIEGSTSSRTRLYQMGISTFWHEIGREFEIYGKVGRDWVPFKKGVNYKAFLIFKKIR
ncbi:hypothetical protein Q4E93_26850 [Flavitalea sp. BT771]|uniref:DUF6934 family protein n=1 Tax=Flavitalea sp. BT771 TaxID=3063329 RepID=UPI0026E167D6|nr:hypothetical protein [Flavitalea sp. BT771]MDO6434258.1 hypothetical protein [Flavitalea sp. BT771]MDV6223158.1 hypothetical protein [Flavitalea sp. BT771]